MEVKQWPGLIADADPHDLPEGAAVVQENCQSSKPGSLVSRGGLKKIGYDALSGSADHAYQTIATFAADLGATGKIVLILSSNGSVRYAVNPQ